MKTKISIAAILILMITAGAFANSVDSSTIVFQGTLTDNGNGSFTGTIPATAGNYYVTGGGGAGISTAGGFDVFARAGAGSYVQGYYGTGNFNCGGLDTYRITSNNDAYPSQLEGGPWGSWYTPDCADWTSYELELTADHWYLRYAATGESPMSGDMDWAGLYAGETDLGTQDGGNGGSASKGGGPAAWDWDCGWGVEVIPLELGGFAVDVNDLGAGTYEITLTPAAPADTLILETPAASLYVKTGEVAIIDMDVENLSQKVNGCQAMLGYDSAYFPNPTAGVVTPGGGPWDLVIYDSWDVGTGIVGEIDTAIGIDVQSTMTGTDADGTVAKIALAAGTTEGATTLAFRADVPGDETKQTMFSDLNSLPVWPAKFDSQTIIIDGTAPDVNVISAKQNAVELIGSAIDAIQGTVDIQVTASDALAGLAGAPAVTVTPDGGSAEAAAFVNESPIGTYNYTWTVTASTANGIAQICASVDDKAGNNASDCDDISVNKTRITAIVSMDTLSTASYSFNRLVTFKATDALDTVIKTWDETVTFTNDTVLKIASGSYSLDNVPVDTANVSAKTNWSLRDKQAVVFDGDMQGTAADLMMLGGDMNGSNTTTILDYSILKTNWLTLNIIADLTGDGGVNVFDYAILKKNFFQTGSPE